MTIEVTLSGTSTPIERCVFVGLFENSVARGRMAYLRALESEEISFSDLVELSRKSDIPYTLFFAPHAVVEAQIEAKTAKLLQGVTKKTFSVNSRATVALSDIELIVKDLIRKQELLKRYDTTLVKNQVVGLIKRSRGSARADADALLGALELSPDAIRSAKSKSAALELLIGHLESHQVLVSRSVNGFMPQSLTGVHFSGITVRDAKVPYVFLAGGSHGDFEEPAGRQIFTLTLLSVLVARRRFAPVTYDGRSISEAPGREYEIVGQILMPIDEMKAADLSSLESVKAVSDQFKVTPSAITVRAMHLGLIGRGAARGYLGDLEQEFAQRPKSQARTPKPVNGVRRYNGREFSVRMLDALDAGKLSERNFCREATLNRLEPSQIGDFRLAVR